MLVPRTRDTLAEADVELPEVEDVEPPEYEMSVGGGAVAGNAIEVPAMFTDTEDWTSPGWDVVSTPAPADNALDPALSSALKFCQLCAENVPLLSCVWSVWTQSSGPTIGT